MSAAHITRQPRTHEIGRAKPHIKFVRNEYWVIKRQGRNWRTGRSGWMMAAWFQYELNPVELAAVPRKYLP